jgi:hypothetical protein
MDDLPGVAENDARGVDVEGLALYSSITNFASINVGGL